MSLIPMPAPVPVPRSTFDLLPDAINLAAQVASTEFVPAGLRDRPEAVVAAILYGAELGVTPMEALAEISVIEGRPAISAQLMRRLVLQAGHELWAEEATASRCALCARRAGSERVHKVTWTLDDARKAGLANRPNWTRYPREMLIARATAIMCRTFFADVLGAARYVPDELEGGDGPPDAGFVPESGTEGPVRRTRRRPPPAPVAPAAIDTTASIEPAGRPPLPGEPLEPGMMTDHQRKKMMAGLRELGLDDRTQRMEYVCAVVEREIDSSSALTKVEAARVIDAVEADLRERQGLPPVAHLFDQPDDEERDGDES